MDPVWVDFKISEDEDGIKHAISPELQISVLPELKDARVYHHNRLKPMKIPTEHTRMLVVDAEGVRIYFAGPHVIIKRIPDHEQK